MKFEEHEAPKKSPYIIKGFSIRISYNYLVEFERIRGEDCKKLIMRST
jgi:hypothetical protein